MLRLAKFMQIFAGLFLLAVVIVRFVFFAQLGSVPNVIMTFYFIFFAGFMLLFEFGIMRIKAYFYLLNFFWGRALWDFFIACMCISSPAVPAMDIVAGIVFFVATAILGLISCCFIKEERKRIDEDLAKMESLWKVRMEQY